MVYLQSEQTTIFKTETNTELSWASSIATDYFKCWLILLPRQITKSILHSKTCFHGYFDHALWTTLHQQLASLSTLMLEIKYDDDLKIEYKKLS